MELVERVRRWFRGPQAPMIDYESYDQGGQIAPPQTGFAAAAPGGAGMGALTIPSSDSPSVAPAPQPGTSYKIQQSYDSLLNTVQELRSALDGQAARQEELFDRLSTLP